MLFGIKNNLQWGIEAMSGGMQVLDYASFGTRKTSYWKDRKEHLLAERLEKHQLPGEPSYQCTVRTALV